MLVLNYHNSHINKATLFTFDGKDKRKTKLNDQNVFLGATDDDLSFGLLNGAQAFKGCGATLNGEFWYFGGIHANFRQVG